MANSPNSCKCPAAVAHRPSLRKAPTNISRHVLTDTHAHLDYSEFPADFPSVIARADAAGVKRLISIGTGLDSSRAAIALAEKWPQVWAVAGVHPNHVPDERPDF